MLPANAQFVFGALVNTWHMHVYNRLRNRPTPHSIADILGLRESESDRPDGKDALRGNDRDSSYAAEGFSMPPDSNTDSRGGIGSITPYSNDDGRGTQNSRSSLADGETSSEGMMIIASKSSNLPL